MIRISTAAAACLAVLALSACATSTDTADTTPAMPSAPAATPAAPAATASASNAAAIEAGQGIFQARCSGCHREGAAAPGRTALKGFSHARIVEALTTGKMMAQGRSLSDEDKNNVATFLTQGPTA